MTNDFDGLTPCSEHINEPVYSWSWWGAMLLAKRIISIIQLGDAAFKKPKDIVNLLEFLLKNKMDMLNYIYNEGIAIGTIPIKDKKGKIKEYKPYKLIWEANTAKILLEALNSACTMLSIFTQKSPDEIFNLLIKGQDIPKEEK